MGRGYRKRGSKVAVKVAIKTRMARKIRTAIRQRRSSQTEKRCETEEFLNPPPTQRSSQQRTQDDKGKTSRPNTIRISEIGKSS